MVIAIEIWFGLTRFQKYLCVCAYPRLDPVSGLARPKSATPPFLAELYMPLIIIQYGNRFQIKSAFMTRYHISQAGQLPPGQLPSGQFPPGKFPPSLLPPLTIPTRGRES